MIKARDPQIAIEIARDGFEVCRRLRARPTLNYVRIAAMTGFPSPGNIERIMTAGADACLPKPLILSGCSLSLAWG